MFVERTGRQHEQGNVAGNGIGLYPAAHLESVHDRHHHVADDKVGDIGAGSLITLLAVGGKMDGITRIMEDVPQQFPHIRIVIDHQYLFSFTGIAFADTIVRGTVVRCIRIKGIHVIHSLLSRLQWVFSGSMLTWSRNLGIAALWIEHTVYQCGQPAEIALHHLYQFMSRMGQVAVGKQGLYGGDEQGERRAEPVSDLGEEQQTRIRNVLHLAVELGKFLMPARKFIVQTGLGQIGTVEQQSEKNDDDYDNDESGNDTLLHVQTREIGVHTAVQHFKVLTGTFHLPVLQCHKLGVALVDDGGLQDVDTLELLVGENLACQTDHLQSLCGVDVRSLHLPACHGLYTTIGRRQTVHAEIQYAVQALAHGHMTCSEGQTVVVAEDTVYVAPVDSGTLEDFRHGLFSVAHGPALCTRADDADGRMCTEGIGKTAVTLHGCRRPLQALQLSHHASAAHTVCHTLAHCETDDIIVGTDVGGIFVALRMTVKEYDGNASIVRLVDGMHKGVR